MVMLLACLLIDPAHFVVELVPCLIYNSSLSMISKLNLSITYSMCRHNSIYFGPARHLNFIFSAKDQLKVNMLKLDTV